MNRIVILCASLCSAHALADYQYEVEASGMHAEAYAGGSRGFSGSSKIWSAAGVYYLTPVDTESVPLADAAFLNKASWGRVSVNRAKSHFVDEDQNTVAGQWVSGSGFIIGFNYEHTQFGERYYDLRTWGRVSRLATI